MDDIGDFWALEMHSSSRVNNFVGGAALRMTMKSTLGARIAQARENQAFRNYEAVRECVFAMMDDWVCSPEGGPSAYWREEIEGFAYLFDASPLLIEKLRDQCYHLTGLKSYEYRAHHSHKTSLFENKFRMLAAQDETGLFVPEAPDLGGFGFEVGKGLANVDTLKFYEVLIGLDKAGLLRTFRDTNGRKTVMEIGAGWGGFARAFKTICPLTTYICVDLPPTILFSGVYLRTLFPDAKFLFYGERGFHEKIRNYAEFDFVFLPHFYFDEFWPREFELAINMVSFQEMTEAQVESYVQGVRNRGVKALYSLNRDRSKHNSELGTVSGVLAAHFNVRQIHVLDIPYTDLKPPKGPVARGVHDYWHYAASP